MPVQAIYPTPEHQAAAAAIVEFLATTFEIEAVLLVNSCARGRASRDSCLDLIVLAKPELLASHRSDWEQTWENFNGSNPVIGTLKGVGAYSVVHLDFIDGLFVPPERDEAAGPDGFELELGNFLAYSVTLWSGSAYLTRLKQRWLPYYDEALRRQRLAMVRYYCLNNLHHIPLYVERGLYFQAFDRLYNAYQEFLQALFISRRTYPIAYNKWIREQVVELLALPELYGQLVHLLEIRDFASSELATKAGEVERLLETYAPDPAEVGANSSPVKRQ